MLEKNFINLLDTMRKILKETNWEAVEQNIATATSILKDEELNERIKSNKPKDSKHL